MLKVKGHTELVRDESTKAILNISSGYDEYIKKKNQRKQQQEEIEQLKNDMSDIKSMLVALINKIDTEKGG